MCRGIREGGAYYSRACAVWLAAWRRARRVAASSPGLVWHRASLSGTPFCRAAALKPRRYGRAGSQGDSLPLKCPVVHLPRHHTLSRLSAPGPPFFLSGELTNT